MEEEVISYDNIVNNMGSKRPQMDGEWTKWNSWDRDRLRGRINNRRGFHVKSAQHNSVNKKDDVIESPKVVPKERYGGEYSNEEIVLVNREHIPYEFPRGKNDTRIDFHIFIMLLQSASKWMKFF